MHSKISTNIILGVLSFSFLIIQTPKALALNKKVEALVKLETQANAAAVRSPAPVDMIHYEIPLHLLTEAKETGMRSGIYESLVFEKNGELFVRWVTNPEDTKWYKNVEQFMREHGIEPERKTYFKGYQTASRSYIIEDPSGKVQFSIKSSTDRTGGAWRDKKQQYDDGFDIHMISDLVLRAQKQKPFEHIIVMQEPLTFGIQSIDQSIVVRDLAGLVERGGRYYLPGFSALHDSIGKQIATKNGSTNPYEFWTKHYVEAVGRAAAEFAARTGLWYDSPHSQNFLIELDQNFKPTGRIVLRDMGDVYLNAPLLKKLGQEKIVDSFSLKENIHSHLSIAFGPLHGNSPPTWINNGQYSLWANDFSQAFISEYSKQTGIPESALDKPFTSSTYSYIQGRYNLDSVEFKSYINQLKPISSWCRKVFSN